jgi:hypothetical protein
MDDKPRNTSRAHFDESTVEAALSLAKDRRLSSQDRRHAADVAAFILERVKSERLVAEAMRHVSASLGELLVIRRLLRAPSETAGSIANAIEDMPESTMRVRLARAYVELLERETKGR